MKSIHQDRYDAQEISDALDVLVDLPHTKDEAISVIQEHLMDYAGELVFADLPDHVQSELTDGHAYPVFHLKSLAYDRIEARDSDLDAAKEATRAAELERAAALNKEKGKDIVTRAGARARRVKERAARAAARAEKRAMRKEKEATRLRKRAGAAKQRGDARGDRITRFGTRRAGWQDKASQRKEARAAKKREAARRALNSSDEE
ncbi:MAG: hypothetical protein K2Q45_07055 [Nitrosomonas sp.]|nr:hypothetical protein [Nitrosomonas sp.]